MPIDRSFEEQVVGNPFWSERARREAQLVRARPRELPPVPDDGSWEAASDTSAKPLEHGNGRRSRTPGTQRGRKERESSRPRDGRSRMSSGGTFKTIPGSWTHEEPLRTEGVMEEQTPEAEPLKTAGVMNGLTPDEEEIFQSAKKTDALEREIEKSMFEKIQEENHALRLELENIKKAMGVKQSSGVGEQTPPPPPPRDGEERRGNAQERFTPNGTKVPSLPPPEVEVPPWPFEQYEPAEPVDQWMQLGPTPPPIVKERHHQVQRLDERTGWLEQELAGMKRALESERRRAGAEERVLSSRYWQEPFVKMTGSGGHHDQVPLCRASGDGGCGQAPLSRAEPDLLQRDRALQAEGIYGSQPLGRVLGGELHGDRASALDQQGPW